MSAYTVSIDGGNGGRTTIEADDLQEAWAKAVEWARDGDWDSVDGDWDSVDGESVHVHLRVTEVDEDGEPTGEERAGSVCVLDAEDAIAVPECPEDDAGHEWCADHDLVGGCDSNPGVWSLGGMAWRFVAACRHCGLRRITEKDEQPGQISESVRYEQGEATVMREHRS